MRRRTLPCLPWNSARTAATDVFLVALSPEALSLSYWNGSSLSFFKHGNFIVSKPFSIGQARSIPITLSVVDLLDDPSRSYFSTGFIAICEFVQD